MESKDVLDRSGGRPFRISRLRQKLPYSPPDDAVLHSPNRKKPGAPLMPWDYQAEFDDAVITAS